MHYPKLVKRVHAWIIDSLLFFFIFVGSLFLPTFIGIELAFRWFLSQFQQLGNRRNSSKMSDYRRKYNLKS